MSNDTSVLLQDPATDAIYFKDATELATLIRTKQISSREVVQAHLDRIARVNPKVNAIVTLMADDALRGAELADQAVKAGVELGPLHGVSVHDQGRHRYRWRINPARLQNLRRKHPGKGRHRRYTFQGCRCDSTGQDESPRSSPHGRRQTTW